MNIFVSNFARLCRGYCPQAAFIEQSSQPLYRNFAAVVLISKAKLRQCPNLHASVVGYYIFPCLNSNLVTNMT